MKLVYVIVLGPALGLLSLPALVSAQDKPTPAEAKKVIDYYFHGKGKGVVPMSYLLCEEVHDQGEEKHNCKVELDEKTLKKGQEAYLWMNFLVPAGDEAKLLLQFRRKGMVRKTSNVTLGGATRYRTWKRLPTDTPGDWQVKIIQELENADMEIGKVDFSVVEAAQ